MKTLLLFLLSGIAFGQTAQYPASVVTDSQLMVAKNLLTTKLVTALTPTDTSLVVASNVGFTANMLVTVGIEIIKISGTVGSNVLTVDTLGRGFDGSTAIAHPVGTQASVFLDAWHHMATTAELKAVQQTLGANMSNVPGSPSGGIVPVNKGGTGASTAQGTGAKVQLSSGATTPNDCVKFDATGNTIDSGLPCNTQATAATFNFPPQAPGGSLIIGANVITLATGPMGMTGSDLAHYVYLSGGTGTAEAGLISGGTCTPGAIDCTLIVTAANTHTGAWTITSASGGIQEAICSLPAAGGAVQIAASLTLTGTVSACGKTTVSVTKQPGAILTGAFTILGASSAGDGRNESFSGAATYNSAFTVGGAPTGAVDSFRINLNGFPASAQQHGGQVGAVSAITGAVDVLSTWSGTGGIGVSGYGRTGFTGPAIGGYFQGSVAGNGAPAVSTWGLNSVTQNCDGTYTGPTSCLLSAGYNSVNLYGYEVDMNVVPIPGGTAPSGNAIGIYVIGGSRIQPSGMARAIDIAQMGTFNNIGWKDGLYLEDGSATVSAISIGTMGLGNGVSSMPVLFRSRLAGGGPATSSIFSDPLGDLTIQASPGASLLLNDAGLNLGAAIVPNGTTPYLRVPSAIRMDSAGTVTVPAIKAATGQRFVCVSTTGLLVSSASACSGT